jgi:prepilin-type N-terminal cleavage/methylation domain-containing protein
MKIRKGETSGNLCRRKNSHRGFTLVETIIAFVLLGIILLALTLVPIMTTRLMGDTVEREKAVMLAIGRLDQLESSFDLIQPGSEIIGLYNLSWVVSADGVDNKFVDLSISWNGIIGTKNLEFKRQYSR